MVDEASPPLPAQRRILTARDQARVFQRDHRLVIVTIERPGLHLALRAFAAVQQHMERVQPMIAPRADVAQLRFEFGRRHRLHSVISIPSSAISQPLPSTCRRSGEPAIRIGLVLLMCTIDAPAREPSRAASEPSVAVDRHVAHAAAGLGAGSGRDHLVVAKEGAVEEDDIGAFDPVPASPASPRRRRGYRRCARRRRKARCRHLPPSRWRSPGCRLRDRAAPCPAP